MKRFFPSYLISFLFSYFILASYFNLIPKLLHMNDGLRVVHMLLFFPVAYGVAKLVANKGLDQYGVVFVRGWRTNLGFGFLAGFLAWSVLFLLYFLLGKYELAGMNFNSRTGLVVASVLFGYGFGSFISDMIVRGLVFNHWKGKLRPAYVFAIALILYALDDIWYEGLDFQNTMFSLALGLGLTYAYSKTNSIWASAGIHFGLNTVYGLFFGVTGRSEDGLFSFTTNPSPGFLVTWLSTLLALLLFLLVRRTIHNFARNDDSSVPGRVKKLPDSSLPGSAAE